MIFAQVDVSETEVKDFQCALQGVCNWLRRVPMRLWQENAGRWAGREKQEKSKEQATDEETFYSTVFCLTFVLLEDLLHHSCFFRFGTPTSASILSVIGLGIFTVISCSFLPVATFQMKLDVDLLEYAFDGDLEAKEN